MSEAGFFEITELEHDGRAKAPPKRAKTLVGVMLLIPLGIDFPRVKLTHLLDLAINKPGYPVDLTHFEGEGDAQRLVWSARVYYREPVTAERNRNSYWKCFCGSFAHPNLKECPTCGRKRP